MKVIVIKPIIESNRITLSDDICRRLDVRKGDYLSFVENDAGDIVLKKVVV